MSQLVLPISPGNVPTLDNFVEGRNSELLAALRHVLAGGETSLFLWGEPGCGKSHLLQACVAAAVAAGRAAIYVHGSVPEPADMVAIDDVEVLDAEAQIALFDLYNRMRDDGGLLLVSGQAAPLHLHLRDDLRTRLGWGLVYQVHGLSDAEKGRALGLHARARGFVLSPEVTQYLLRHGRRDLPSLMATLEALDEHSLRRHRAPSVPLLKEVMQLNHGELPK